MGIRKQLGSLARALVQDALAHEGVRARVHALGRSLSNIGGDMERATKPAPEPKTRDPYEAELDRLVRKHRSWSSGGCLTRSPPGPPADGCRSPAHD